MMMCSLQREGLVPVFWEREWGTHVAMKGTSAAIRLLMTAG